MHTPVKFTLATAAAATPMNPQRRQSILAQPLTAAEKEVYDIPIEAWKNTDRAALAAGRCTITGGVAAQDIPRVDASHPVLSRMGVHRGPVTTLALDAIVNAANEVCLGGGGVDGAIHRAAGRLLQRECATHNGCPTGEALVTKGYGLPARYVVHTVGPVGEKPALLRRCYQSVLSLAAVNGLRSIGLCGISTGVYGYPLRPATHIAVQEVAAFLKNHPDALDLVSFACFQDSEAAALAEELASTRAAGGFD